MREKFIYNKIENLIKKNRVVSEESKISLLNSITKVSDTLKALKGVTDEKHNLLKSEINGIIKTIGELEKALALNIEKAVNDFDVKLTSIPTFENEIKELQQVLNNYATKEYVDKKIPDVDKKINKAIKNFVDKNDLKALESKIKDNIKIKEIQTEIKTEFVEPTFEVGKVTTVGSGEEAEVDVIKEDNNYILNFKIPKGMTVKGAQGKKGNTNLFIQSTQPITTETTYMWWETNPDKTLKTLWVETGGAE